MARPMSSRATTPTISPPEATGTPEVPRRRHSARASSMVLSASTNQGGDDMMSAARGPAAMPSASAAPSRARAPSSVSSRTSAEAAWAWPPPPRAAITAATSKAAVRLRPTANTRPSISTSITIAGLSVRSVILEARVDTPST